MARPRTLHWSSAEDYPTTTLIRPLAGRLAALAPKNKTTGNNNAVFTITYKTRWIKWVIRQVGT